ncbi:hypothetical protein CAAN1_21S02718 [[Candida] anglica]|uniref:NmrA-like domain-containing protein n=1 Tax=[Candida] anglica TaxID=148631 RepID=A0ABP0EE34_9ASCO
MSDTNLQKKPSILIAGPNGSVGKHVVNAIIQNRDSFSQLAIITKEDGPKYDHLRNKGFEIVLNEEGVKLEGFDIFFIALSFEAVQLEMELIELAIKSGIKTIYPSEFGLDIDSIELTPLNEPRKNIRQFLRQKHSEGVVDYVFVVANAFLDWGLDFGFWGYDLTKHEATIYNGGNYDISWTFIEDLGQSIVRSFLDDSTRNTVLNLSTISASQNDILREFEVQIGSTWKRVDVSSDSLSGSEELLEKGDFFGALQLVLHALSFNRTINDKFNGLPVKRYPNLKLHTLQEVITSVLSSTKK